MWSVVVSWKMTKRGGQKGRDRRGSARSSRLNLRVLPQERRLHSQTVICIPNPIFWVSIRHLSKSLPKPTKQCSLSFSMMVKDRKEKVTLSRCLTAPELLSTSGTRVTRTSPVIFPAEDATVFLRDSLHCPFW